MNPWLETIGVILVAVLGILLGRAFSGLRKRWWALGYFIPAALIAMLIVGGWPYSLAFVPPFFWIATGRIKFVILSLAITMGLTTPLSRLPRRCEKLIICILMTVIVAWFSVAPFLVPALIRNKLASLETRVNPNGICFQSTEYTCGPAAAVTALRKLGLPAEEGEIAVLSHSSPVTGTLPVSLYKALQNRYAAEGLKCQYRHFDSLAQLRDAGVTLAVVRDAFLSDHCVAVLEVSDWMVVLADPVLGRQLMSHEQFEKIWRFSGIVLERGASRSI
ncbi:MAG TPA: cysteine peptidase family C39 domain-containing protein [Sedimentisphaerales bacterium]|nr:cysteine peptidase family C39 domain-containing protein [Sedimentisphaerales bacterium]